MPLSFRSSIRARHNRFFVNAANENPALPAVFRTRVSVRPARLVLQGSPPPRTAELARWISTCAGADKRMAVYFPFVYRGCLAAHVDDGKDIHVSLWEEPSGRPLEAELPHDWFHGERLYKGMPFRLVTWMVADQSGQLSPGHFLKNLTSMEDDKVDLLSSLSMSLREQNGE